jgi:acyl-CoA synthetase (AMP-forming)/AMP-acid ligase II
VDARIVDPETLRELPVGEVGELVTRGAQLMRGYWQNEQANQSAFFELDGQTFFRTGDLASVDEEGYFFMRDRLKRMVNVSGFKVWPAEVENTLYEHPAVHEACVIAVPDDKRGRVLAIYTAMFLGATPFGSLAFGQLGHSIGAGNALLAGALVSMAGVALTAWRMRESGAV